MQGSFSKIELLASLPAWAKQEVLNSLTDEQAAAILWDWPTWARPSQRQPEGNKWLIWLILAGRGWGKTRVGAETIRSWVCGDTPLSRGLYRRIALVAETAADARDVLVEGESGLLACHPRDFRPRYEPSKRRLTWSNGAFATLYNATEPDQLRGPQHDAAWSDELAKWAYVRETWDMLQFGLRSGDHPRQIITTTPRPIPVLKEIIGLEGTVVTGGSTGENRANLAPSFLRTIVSRYEGTRLGRQELNAEILDDVPGALWTRAMLDGCRVKQSALPDMVRVVVGVDPSGTRGDRGDMVGIVVGGKGVDGLGYVLADRSCRKSPAGWGAEVAKAYHEFGADRVIAEVNFGGAMVEHVIRTADPDISYEEVKASRGKIVRAEPVAALYEQSRIKHAISSPTREDQLCAFTPDGYVGEGSPDNADALVWVMTELMLGEYTYDTSMSWVGTAEERKQFAEPSIYRSFR